MIAQARCRRNCVENGNAILLLALDFGETSCGSAASADEDQIAWAAARSAAAIENLAVVRVRIPAL